MIITIHKISGSQKSFLCLIFISLPCSKNRQAIENLYIIIKLLQQNLHRSFSSRLFSLFSLLAFTGRNRERTRMNCRKLIRSSYASLKKACTIRSPRGLIANSGMRRKSSRLKLKYKFKKKKKDGLFFIGT